MPTFGFGTPFQEQLDFFRRKLALPSARWDDIKRAAHDRAFIVAGAGQADLVNDLRQAMLARIEDGRGLEAFRRDFREIAKNHGWTGWTGEGTKAGEAWRTRVIYQTNMATSYAAGRYRQLTDPDLLRVRPYWRYVHADGVLHPRPLHLAWHGITLPHDHPFWQTHFPPNGWGCKCRIVPVDAAQYRAAQKLGLAEPPAGWDKIDSRTGAPVGIDKGFAYAPGANAMTPLRDMVADKLITYPPAISRALSHEMNRYVLAHEPPSAFAVKVLEDRTVTTSVAWLGFIEDAAPLEAATGHDLRGFAGIIPADAPRHIERAHQRDGGDQRPIVPADYDRVWQVLNMADRVERGHQTGRGLASIVAYKRVGGEGYRAVFEIRPGRRNRTLALVSLVVKRAR